MVRFFDNWLKFWKVLIQLFAHRAKAAFQIIRTNRCWSGAFATFGVTFCLTTLTYFRVNTAIRRRFIGDLRMSTSKSPHSDIMRIRAALEKTKV